MKKTTLLLLLFIWVARIDAQPIESQPLHTVLNSDGTLKQGIRGSFRVDGYQMQLDAKGRPLFTPHNPISNITTPNAWNGQFGLPNGVGNGNFELSAVATDSLGNCYVGGAFRLAGGVGVPVNNIARFNTLTNTWSVLGSGGGSGVNDMVKAIAVAGNDIIVGGDFTQANVGGTVVNANRVARFNLTTNTWSALGTGGGNGVNSSVSAIKISGSEVFVGGDFTQANVGGTVVIANYVARFNLTTNTWSALGTGGGNGVNSNVYAISVLGNDVFMGGDFTQANVGGTVVNANRVARFNTTTNTWSALGTGGGNGVNNAVFALAVSGGDVYVGGRFTQANVGGTVVNPNRVARFNTTTNTWSTLGTGGGNGVNNSSGSSSVNAIAVVGSDVFVGGDFRFAGGLSANLIARFNTSTNTWSALGSTSTNGVNGFNVNALAAIGNDLFVGGKFGSVNGGGSATVMTSLIARFNTTTNAWSQLAGAIGISNGVNLFVDALAVVGSDVIVGGQFRAVGGLSNQVNYIARFNTTTKSWSPLTGAGGGNGVNGDVYALAVVGSDVYVGGTFTQANVGGTVVNANRVARFNLTTNTWSALASADGGNGVNSNVYALTVSGNDIFVGGNFNRANVGGTNVNANCVARFNLTTNTWSALASTSGGNGVSSSGSPRVNTIAVVGNNVFVGGDFNFANIGGPIVDANYIARFNTTANTWSPLGSGGGNGVNDHVHALANLGNDIFVGGRFTQANTGGTIVNANYVARFNTTANTWSPLGSGGGNGVDYWVKALALAGNDLYVSGQFTQANVGGTALNANRVARFNLTNNTWNVLGNSNGNGVNEETNTIAVVGSDVYVGGRFDQANVGGSSPIVSAFIGRYFGGTSSTEKPTEKPHASFRLAQNYPNPFNPTTTIAYQLPVGSQVSLKIYDVLGREVATLVNTRQSAGYYTFTLNASNLASGIYFYRLQAGNFVSTKKMMLVK